MSQSSFALFVFLAATAGFGLASASVGADEPAAGKKKIKLKPIELPKTYNAHSAGDVVLAGQPSQEALAELSKRNVRTVISLRDEQEETWDEESHCESLGMKFLRFPINNPDDVSAVLIDQIRLLLEAARPEAGVLLHCASANRVGAVWLAHRVKDGGLTVDQARQEAAKVGLKTKVLEKKAIEYLEP